MNGSDNVFLGFLVESGVKEAKKKAGGGGEHLLPLKLNTTKNYRGLMHELPARYSLKLCGYG